MSAAAAPRTGTTPSRHSLYCSNLPDKLQKDDLKRALYMLFSTYGPILDIVALKTPRMRGQAHVLFRDMAASTQAMERLQGHDFFGKQMKIAYANSKSDTLAKLDGTYRQPQSSTAVTTTTGSAPGQQSVFAAPPGASAASTAATLSAPPAGTVPAATNGTAATTASPSPAPVLGKRGRDEEDEDEEAPMEMDDDAMEESDPE